MNFERSRLKYAAYPLMLSLGLGVSACSPSQPEKKSSQQGTLSNVRLIGAAKDGHYNAVNGGEAATVYDPDTYKNIGTIAAGQAFEIICETFKPNAFVVEVSESQQGNVNVTNELAAHVVADESFAVIPNC